MASLHAALAMQAVQAAASRGDADAVNILAVDNVVCLDDWHTSEWHSVYSIAVTVKACHE